MLERNRTKDVPIGVVVVALVVIGVAFYVYKIVPQTSPQEQIAPVQQEPQKTDFDTTVPSDFPTDIPIENGAQVQQSYELNYVGQKQLTIVFLSAKTVADNYILYADFLKKQNWNILNTYVNPAVSSLYGIKEGNDINVTITENTSKSQVSISVLRKL